MELEQIEEIKSIKYLSNSKLQQIISDSLETINNNIPTKRLLERVKKYNNLEIITIKYISDGLKIFGMIFKHKDCKINTPTLIYSRGGNNHIKRRTGQLTVNHFFNSKYLELVNDNKLIVISSDLRGSLLSEGKDEFLGNDINDIINLYPIIKKYRLMNQNKIGIFGWSRGSTGALNVLKRVDWIKCLILGTGPISLEKKYWINFRPKLYDMWVNPNPDIGFGLSETELINRSPIYFLDKISNKIPILFMYGTNDKKVEITHVQLLQNVINKLNLNAKLIIYKGGNHALNNTDEILKNVKRDTNNFLNENLIN
jgi:dipeptidyl aminopeptidase/acylaminoacyl peptidase